MTTDFEEQFRRLGFPKWEAEFLCAISKALNNGGTIDRAHELVDYAASRMSGEGQRNAREGQIGLARPGRPTEDAAGHAGNAREGQEKFARPSSPGAGTGQGCIADEASPGMPVPRPMSDRRRKALARVSDQRVRTFWDTEVGGVKRRLGSLTRFDIRQVVRRGMIDVHIGNRLLTEIEWPDDDKTALENIADIKQVKKIVESAATVLERAHA